MKPGDTIYVTKWALEPQTGIVLAQFKRSAGLEPCEMCEIRFPEFKSTTVVLREHCHATWEEALSAATSMRRIAMCEARELEKRLSSIDFRQPEGGP